MSKLILRGEHTFGFDPNEQASPVTTDAVVAPEGGSAESVAPSVDDAVVQQKTRREMLRDRIGSIDVDRLADVDIGGLKLDASTDQYKDSIAEGLFNDCIENTLGWGKFASDGRSVFGDKGGTMTGRQKLRKLQEWANGTGDLMSAEQDRFNAMTPDEQVAYGQKALGSFFLDAEMNVVGGKAFDAKAMEVVGDARTFDPNDPKSQFEYAERMRKAYGAKTPEEYYRIIAKDPSKVGEAFAQGHAEATAARNAEIINRTKQYLAKQNTLQTLEANAINLSDDTRAFVASTAMSGEFDRSAFDWLPDAEKLHALALVKIRRGELNEATLLGVNWRNLRDEKGEMRDITRTLYGVGWSITDIFGDVGRAASDIASVVNIEGRALMTKMLEDRAAADAYKKSAYDDLSMDHAIHNAMTQDRPDASTYAMKTASGFGDNFGFLLISEVGGFGKLIAARGLGYAQNAAKLVRAEQAVERAQKAYDLAKASGIAADIERTEKALQLATGTLSKATEAEGARKLMRGFERLGEKIGKAEGKLADKMLTVENEAKDVRRAVNAYVKAKDELPSLKKAYNAARDELEMIRAGKKEGDIAKAVEKVRETGRAYGQANRAANPTAHFADSLSNAQFYNDIVRAHQEIEKYNRFLKTTGRGIEVSAKVAENAAWFMPFYARRMDRAAANGEPIEQAAHSAFVTMLWSGVTEKAAFTKAAKLGIGSVKMTRQSFSTIGSLVGNALVRKMSWDAKRRAAAQAGKIFLEREATNLAHGLDTAFNVTAQSVADEWGVMLSEVWNENKKIFDDNKITKGEFLAAFTPDERWVNTCIDTVKQGGWAAAGFAALSGTNARFGHWRHEVGRKNFLKRTMGETAYSNYKLKGEGLLAAHDNLEKVTQAALGYHAGELADLAAQDQAESNLPDATPEEKAKAKKSQEDFAKDAQAKFAETMGKVFAIAERTGGIRTADVIARETGVDQATAELLVSVANDYAALSVRDDARQMYDEFLESVNVSNAEFAMRQFVKYAPNIRNAREDEYGNLSVEVDVGNGNWREVGMTRDETVTKGLIANAVKDDSDVGRHFDERQNPQEADAITDENGVPYKNWKAMPIEAREQYAAHIIEGNNRKGGSFYMVGRDGERVSMPVADLITLTQKTNSRAVSHEISHTIYRAAEEAGFITLDMKAAIADAIGIDRTSPESNAWSNETHQFRKWEVEVDEAVARGYAEYTQGKSAPALPQLRTAYDAVNRAGNWIIDTMFGGAEAVRGKETVLDDLYEVMMRGDLESLKYVVPDLQGEAPKAVDAQNIRNEALAKFEKAQEEYLKVKAQAAAGKIGKNSPKLKAATQAYNDAQAELREARYPFVERFSLRREITVDAENADKDTALAALKNLAGKPLHNDATGIDAMINTNQRGKLVSRAAIRKSIDNGFTFREHDAAVGIIDKLWKHAELIETRGDEKNGDDGTVASIKRFVSPVYFGKNGEKEAFAYITAKESVEHGHRVYTLELEKLEMLEGMLSDIGHSSSSIGDIVSNLRAKFNGERWSLKDAEWDDLEKNFGVTKNPLECGWITPNGKMLDFSGAHWTNDKKAPNPNHRMVDHADVKEVIRRSFDSNWEYRNEMLNSGAIRTMPEIQAIGVATSLTEAQEDAVYDYIDGIRGGDEITVEFYGDDMRSTDVARFNGRVSPQAVIRAIREHFDSVAAESGANRFSLATPQDVKRLDAGKTLKTYRTFQVVDGKLYSPMAAKFLGEDGKYHWGEAIEIGKWYKNDERPDDAVLRPSNGRYYFTLDKGNGSKLAVSKDGRQGVAYNPYWHSSNLVINDQFTSAWNRPNLVTVECEIPMDETVDGVNLDDIEEMKKSGREWKGDLYWAEKAHASIGRHAWHKGTVAAQVDTERSVYLTRFLKPVRIMSDAEVADKYIELFNGKDVKVPEEVIPPNLRDALVERGVSVVPMDDGRNSLKSYGLPYQGSNGQIAPEIVNVLPEVDRFRHGDAVVSDRGDVKSVESQAMQGFDAKETKTNADGETVAEFDGDRSRWSLRTWDEGGRDILREYLDKEASKVDGLSKKDAKKMLAEMDEIYNAMRDLEGKYVQFGVWSRAIVGKREDGTPVMCVIKTNGDYDMNLDFSTLCKKRRAFDRVLREIVRRGDIDKMVLDERNFVEINRMIREAGFEVACELCFVDSKRYRGAGIAAEYAKMYNRLVNTLLPKGGKTQVEKFNLGENPDAKRKPNGLHTLSKEQVAPQFAALDAEVERMKREIIDRRWEDAAEKAKENQASKKSFDAMKKLISPKLRYDVAHAKKVLSDSKYQEMYGGLSKLDLIAKNLKDDPSSRRHLVREDLIDSTGFYNAYKGAPAIVDLYNNMGTAKPKETLPDVQFIGGEIVKSKSWTPDAAFAVGGVRVQSFSDFVPHMVFDYMQMIAELAAKGLPAHAYTKEPLFARIFGMTGLKVNMSLVPYCDVRLGQRLISKGGKNAGQESGKIGRKYAGMTVESGYDLGDIEYDRNGDAILTPDQEKHLVYYWNEGGVNAEGVLEQTRSFPFEEAMKIIDDKRYADNVGTIAVGVSDFHIRRMLRDPRIRMVIPYHKSSISPIVARLYNIDFYQDFSDVQTTKGAKATLKECPTFNDLIREHKSARKAAEAYLKWCGTHDCVAKFSQFAPEYKDGKIVYSKDKTTRLEQENYYKLLEDFTCDVGGKYKPQSPVRMAKDAFPAELMKLVERGLTEDDANADALEKALSGDEMDLANRIVRELGIRTPAERNARNSLAVPPELRRAFTTEDLLAMAAAGRLAKNPTGEESVREDMAKRLKALKPESTEADVTALMSRAKGDASAVMKGMENSASAEIMNRLTTRQIDRYFSTLRSAGKKGIGEGVRAERARQELDDRQAQKIADSIAAQTGIAVNELEATLGVDLAETMIRLQDIFDEAEKANGGTEEGEDGKTEGDAEDADPMPLTAEQTPEEKAALDKAIRDLCEDIRQKAWEKTEAWKAKQDERKAKRKAAEAEADAEAEDDLPPEDLPTTAEDLAQFIADKRLVDLRNPEHFAQFVATMCEQKWIADHGLRPDAYIWSDPVALQHLRMTAANVYDALARKLMYSGRRETAFNTIGKIENAGSYGAVIGEMVFCGKVIAQGMITERAKELVKDLDQLLAEGFGATGRFKQNEEDINRKVTGETEKWARAVRKVLYWGEQKCANEMERIIERLAGVDAEFMINERDPQSSKQFNKDMMLLGAIREFGGMLHRSLGEITDARLKILDRLEADHVAEDAVLRDERTQAMADILDKAFDTGRREMHDDPKDGKLAKAGKALDRYFQMHLDFKNLLIDLMRHGKDKASQAQAMEFVNNLQHDIQRRWDRAQTEMRKEREWFHRTVEAIYGKGKFDRTMHELFRHDERFDKFGQGEVNEKTGNVTFVKMSKAQAMNLYVAMQQKGYLDNVVKNNRQGQSQELRKLFTKEDLLLMKALGDWYDRGREGLSEVSKRLFGLPVEAEEANYFPVTPLRPSQGLEKGSTSGWSPFPPALTARVRHGLDFDVRADIFSVWMDHMTQQAQWKNMAELGVELRGIFGRQSVQSTIRRCHGQAVLQNVLSFITDILNGQMRTAEWKWVASSLDWARGWAALAALGGNVGVMIKQTTSIPAFAFECGVVETGKYIAEAFTPEGLAAMRDIWNSDQRLNRWDTGNSEEVTNAFSTQDPSLLKRLMQKSMIFNKVGDSVPALVVGQGLYRSWLRKGLTKEEAMNRTWEVINRTQQTSQMDNLSVFQRRSAVGRAITQFQSTVRQYLSYQVAATRWLAANPTDYKAWQDFSRATVMNMVCAGLYTMGGQLWQWILGKNPDESWVWSWVESVLTSCWSSLFAVGSFAQTASSIAVEGKGQKGKMTIPALDLADNILTDSFKAGYQGVSLLGDALGWGDADVTLDDFLKSLDHMGKRFNSPYRDASKLYHQRILGEESGTSGRREQKRRNLPRRRDERK